MEGAFEATDGRVSNPMQDLLSTGWRIQGKKPCPKGCGHAVTTLESPSGTTAHFSLSGRLHLNCREEDAEAIQLPPIPDQEEILRKAGYVKV
jgi:hypothetical protein